MGEMKYKTQTLNLLHVRQEPSCQKPMVTGQPSGSFSRRMHHPTCENLLSHFGKTQLNNFKPRFDFLCCCFCFLVAGVVEPLG